MCDDLVSAAYENRFCEKLSQNYFWNRGCFIIAEPHGKDIKRYFKYTFFNKYLKAYMYYVFRFSFEVPAKIYFSSKY